MGDDEEPIEADPYSLFDDLILDANDNRPVYDSTIFERLQNGVQVR